MSDLDQRLRFVLAAISAAAAFVWGNVPLIAWILLAAQIVDVLTGIIAAGVTGAVDSDHGWRGIGRKVLTWGVVAVVYLVQQVLPATVPLAEVVMGAYVGVEAMSVVENAGRAGVWVPGIARWAFAKLREAADVVPDDGPSRDQQTQRG